MPVATAIVVFALVLTGPAVGVVQLPGQPAQVGDGTATVADASFGGAASLDRGRFGTGVYYLRIPAATVAVESATGRPRLHYRVEAPNLSFDATTSRVLGQPARGRYELAFPVRGLPEERVRRQSYDVHLSVSVQSFSTDESLARRTATVTVGG